MSSRTGGRPRSDVGALIEAARADFSSRLPAKVAEIATLVGQGDLPEARRAAHRLRGSARTYGFADVGATAGFLEEALVQRMAAVGSDAGRGNAPAGELMDLLERARLAAEERR